MDTASASSIFNAKSIPLKNYTPIISTLALPQIEISNFKPNKKLVWKQTFNVTNYISRTSKGEDKLSLDGETWEYIHSFRYNLTKSTQIGMETSRLYHTGGRTDRFIYNFHDVFSLPQNGRSDLFHDKLYWHISKDQNELVGLTSNTASNSDSIISFHWQPEDYSDSQLNTAIKIPTGSVSKFSSNGEIDAYLSIASSNPDWLRNRSILKELPLSLWYGAGLGYLGTHQKLKSIKQNSLIFSLRGGTAWLVFPGWEIKLQLDTHTPIVDTNLREFGWVPLQITMGTNIEIGSVDLEFYLAEDLRPRSAPDVTFSSAITLSF